MPSGKRTLVRGIAALPGVNVSWNTVPGRSTCSAKSGIDTRSMPTYDRHADHNR